MINNITHLIKKNIKQLIPYQSARRIGGEHGTIWLNANESPVPIFFEAKAKSFNRYPEFQPADLICLYANYANVNCNQVLITRGADEGIELLIKAFCDPGKDAIIYCPPTYDMYCISAQIFQIATKAIPTIKKSWQISLSDIESNLNRVKLIYICNPNNPTGSIISQNDLLYLLEITSGKSIVVIDEAYIEFSPQYSMVNFLKKYSNLVILRTLSKAFSLAGIRCGFTLANEEIIATLQKVIAPYPISVPVSDIAIQALSKDQIKLMQKRVSDLNSNRIWLILQLKKIACVEEVFESHANYVLVKFFMFETIFKELWNKGLILRNQSHKINLNKCIRISIGTKSESLSLVEELKNFSKNNIFSLKGDINEK